MKNISEFHEKLQGYYAFYSERQIWLRKQATKAEQTNDILTSSVYNGKADEVAEMVGQAKALLKGLENLIEKNRKDKKEKE